jgi:hypothetical protein
MKHLRLIFLIASLLGALPTVAKTETITKKEWAKRADGVCAYFNSRRPPGTDDPTWAAAMAYSAKHGTALIKSANRFEKQVEAIPLPVTGKTLAQTWIRLNSQQTTWLKRMVAAAWRHDLAAYQVANRRENERFTSRKPIARALGLKVCTVG